jgi:hypothetical protein
MVKQSGRRIKGEGSIYQVGSGQKEGQWVGQVTVGWKNGKRVAKSVHAQTQKECFKRLNQLKNNISQGQIDDTSTLSEWIKYWLDEICADRVTAKTLYGYRRKMKIYVIPEIGQVRLGNLYCYA